MTWSRYAIVLIGVLAVFAFGSAEASMIDLSTATVVVGDDSPELVITAAELLVDEVEKRTGIRWNVASSARREKPTIRLGVVDAAATEWTADAFHVHAESPNRVVVTGDGPGGVIHGVGYLLRKMELRPRSVLVSAGLDGRMRPKFPLIGHKIGSAHGANSYDAWTLDQFEQYVRELIIFGNTTVESKPINTEGPLMLQTPAEVSFALSRAAEKYGQRFWLSLAAVWDLTDPEEYQTAIETNEYAFKNADYVTDMMVAGGDPGHNHPRDLLPYLREIDALLKRYHPDAGVWYSLQKFEPEKAEWTYEFMNRERPNWIRGIVAGPWDPGLLELKQRMPEGYPFRAYPDITHNMRAQFPVPWWDRALDMTLGREGPNPRPTEMAIIHEAYTAGTVGFIAYTEGTHDDINKVIWNLRSWEPTLSVREILTDYARFFFGPDIAEQVADGILALEQNWQGPLSTNGSVATTYEYWMELERTNPKLMGNWRWEFLLMRAVYDNYVRERLLHERALEDEVNAVLARAGEVGSDAAMAEAVAILAQMDNPPESIAQMREKIVELGEALWQSTKFQSNVEQYGASAPERGAILEFLDLPLNNRWWLEDEFLEIRTLESEVERCARLAEIARWESPGDGSFYDDIGNIDKMPHVMRGETLHTDPFMQRNPNPFSVWNKHGYIRDRISWISDIHWPLGMRYANLDRDAEYRIRMVGVGNIRIRIDGETVEPVEYGPERRDVKEWSVPTSALADGEILITFENTDEGNIHWRTWARVNEVWLLKQ